MIWSEPSGVTGTAEDLESVKRWCNIVEGNTVTDDMLEDMIKAATRYVERHQRRQLLSATYTAYLDDWPESGTIEIRDKLPIQSITSVQYKDVNAATQTVTATNYHTSLASYHSPARIIPIWGYTWPELQEGAVERVIITLTAGYGALSTLPMTTRAAIRYFVGQMVEYREPVVTGTIVAEMPFTVRMAMDADCWGSYA